LGAKRKGVRRAQIKWKKQTVPRPNWGEEDGTKALYNTRGIPKLLQILQ